MKKIVVLVITLIVVTLSGCSSQENYNTNNLKKLTNNYTLEQAKTDNCLVIEDGIITSGQDVFDEFLLKTEKKENSFIRVAKYYTLNNTNMSDEFYETEKDNYPVMHITDVVYNNGTYTTYSYENLDDELFENTYMYMIKDVSTANPEATYTTGTYYILVNDKSLTYDMIMKAMASSIAPMDGDDYRHFVVYAKFDYK